MNIKIKNIELAVLFGLICAMLLSMANFNSACEELRGGVLRLHIRANSDSAADQTVKLAVRDALLEVTDNVFGSETELREAEQNAIRNLPLLTETANRVLKEKGFDYTADISVGDAYFENREYDSFTLPAGTYRSLIVKLGSGEGKNWWCVVFPAVCVPAAEGASLSDSVSEEGCLVAERPQRYVMRFKAIEIYEDIKQIFGKK